MSDTYYIDDQDLSKVVYNGSWVRGGTANEYDGTVASSTRVGDSFTVTFKGTMHVPHENELSYSFPFYRDFCSCLWHS